jgi:phage tail-like protein
MNQMPGIREWLGGLCMVFLLGVGMSGCGMETGAAPFTVNPHRVDPYKNFKFRVKWDGQYVPGISRISPLHRSTEVIIHRDGGDRNAVRPSPGATAFAPILLERGRTHDTAFEDWAQLVWNPGQPAGSEMSLKNFRKDIVVELQNEAGTVALAFMGFRCWPSEYIPLGELASDTGASVAMESLTVQCETWQRDTAVVEPQEN